MNHVGVLATLVEEKMFPRIISGSSAGSIIAGLCCTRVDDELPQLIDDLSNVNWNVFGDSSNPETIYNHLTRLLKMGTLNLHSLI
jgi:TAG lipase/steryl ester hydrolase/phospholipase A2/LPA acyltransferase